MSTPPVATNQVRSEPTVRFPEAVDADIENITRALAQWSDSVAAPSPGNKRGERTRQHLLESATETFMRLGYLNCSVEDILQEANVSRGTFYAHFKSKKAVFAGVVERSLESRLKSTNVSDLDVPLVRDRIEASVRRFLDSYWQSRGLSLVIEQVTNSDPAFREIRLAIRDSFARRIAKGIRGQQARGIADPTVDPVEAGLAIIGMLTQFAHTELGWRARRPTEEMVDLLTRIWVRGIGLDESAPVLPNQVGLDLPKSS